MNDEYDNFYLWQLLGHGNVENNSEYYHCNNKESTMPWLRVIAAVVQGDEALNLGSILWSASLL